MSWRSSAAATTGTSGWSACMLRETLGRRHHADEHDVGGARLLHVGDRGAAAAPGGEHRVDDQGAASLHGRELRVVVARLVGVLVALHAQVADDGVGVELGDGFEQAKARAEDGDRDQALGEPRALEAARAGSSTARGDRSARSRVASATSSSPSRRVSARYCGGPVVSITQAGEQVAGERVIDHGEGAASGASYVGSRGRSLATAGSRRASWPGHGALLRLLVHLLRARPGVVAGSLRANSDPGSDTRGFPFPGTGPADREVNSTWSSS